MITRSNIVEFFEQYKRNLEREEALNEAVLDAMDWKSEALNKD